MKPGQIKTISIPIKILIGGLYIASGSALAQILFVSKARLVI